MKTRLFLLITAFVLSISSLGFICGNDEEDPAQARINVMNSGYVITTISYGSTTWSNLSYSNTPSEYKDIPLSSERIRIYCGGYTYYSSYLSAPEEGRKYTASVSSSNSLCNSSTTFYVYTSED